MSDLITIDRIAYSRAVAPSSLYKPDARFKHLFPYQHAAVEQAGFRQHMLLAHPPGAGKTPIALALVDVDDCVLIVCPPTIAKQWAARAKEWLGVTIPVYDSGNKVKGIRDFSFAIVPDSLIHHLPTNIHVDLLIVDEVHRMKGRETRRTMAVFGSKINQGIAYRSGYVAALTGTPLQNSPVDLFPFLSVCAPSIAPSFKAYTERYCPPVEMKLPGVHFPVKRYDLNLQNLDELALKLRDTVMIRPPVEACLAQLPPLIEDEYVLDIPASQDPSELTPDELADILDGTVSVSAEAAEHTASTRRESGMVKAQSPKFIAWLKDLIEAGESPLIWCWHQSVAEEIAGKLDCGFIHGGVSQPARDSLAMNYSRGGVPLVLTIGSAGTGLDGLQRSGSLCIFVERDYVPSNNEQAVGRLLRIGQTRGVRSIVVRTTLTSDKAIEIILRRKINMTTQALA